MPGPASLAASTTAVVWLTIGLVTTVAVAAVLIALVRHAMVVGRAIGRFQDELTPILEEMNRESASVSRRAKEIGAGPGVDRAS
jgi:hypothetical protein